jgi:hypothetical protein
LIRFTASGLLNVERQRPTQETAGQTARRFLCKFCKSTSAHGSLRLPGAALIVLLTFLLSACRPGPLLTPAPTAEPLVPTPLPPAVFFAPTPKPTLTSSATPTHAPTMGVPLTLTASPTVTTSNATRTPIQRLANDWRQRVGLGVANGVLAQIAWGDARPGWYLDWNIHVAPERTSDFEFVQMARLQQGEARNSAEEIGRAAQTHPGALWLIGNEPDVAWQDNSTPEQYVRAYHDLYQTIKTADPTARLAIGGISQVTPLRMRYLQKIWDLYRAQYAADMPVDVWNIHTFVLREEKDSWGVGLPPGFDDATDGTLWNIEDHNRVDLLQREVVAFRRWMALHGQRQKPLIVSEYGILMPADYGFSPEIVAAYLTDSFTYFSTARDAQVGNTNDDNRLVQRWCWYSTADDVYPTGNLFAWPSLTPTAIFRAYTAFMRAAR